MKRQTWVLGLAVLGGIGWYAFRPELLFVRTHVNESVPLSQATAGASVNTALLSGEFHSVAHETHGRATLHRLADGHVVLRLTDFATSNGPDVRVYLVAAADAADNATVSRPVSSSWASSREPTATRTTMCRRASTWRSTGR